MGYFVIQGMYCPQILQAAQAALFECAFFMKISVIIPTLNGEKQLDQLLCSLEGQSVQPDEIIVVDSASTDGTIAAASAHALVQVISIQRSDFDHGGTRDMALQQSSGDVVLFMTQDALPTDAHYIENLIAPFSDEQVTAVGGRQIAYPDARPFEKAVRSFNYPAADRVWDKADIARLGVRAYLISDVCAAYRRSAYLAVGGFDHPIMTNEDMLMAQKLLQAGYKLAYSGGASVYHSHHFTLRQEYKRNHLIGWTMKHYEERFGHAEEMGEGVKLAVNVVKSLLKQGHVLECIPFAFNCAARLLGNRAGRRAAGKEMA